ncbi:hypothetical protein LXL04_022620 [Taraxacum kok-saghyz]
MPPKPENSTPSFTFEDPPTLEASMADMVNNISQLVSNSTAQQSATQAQLDIIMKHLSTQYEQTNTLLTTLLKPPDKPSSSSSSGSFFKIKGDALCWYKHQATNELLSTWDEFSRSVELRFGPSAYENHQAALFKLRQATTNELALHQPTSLNQAYGLAKLVEEKLSLSKTRYPFSESYLTTIPSTLKPNSANTTAGLLPIPPPPSKQLPFTRLSPDALLKRRSEGLCFKCPEKFFPGHKCNPPQFMLVVDNEDQEPDPVPEQPHTDVLTSPDHQYFLLSTAAFFGLSSPQALRIIGYIQNHLVTILIDCGSTHNIIQPRLVSFFKLHSQPIPEFPVMVGNGDHIKCTGVCPDILVHLEQTPFTIPFLYYRLKEPM